MHVDLFDPGADPGPRPAWQVIEAARRRYLTGLLVLDTTPVTHVYLRDGQVYFAERATDGGLAVRLMVEGVITRAQMQQATLQVSGVEHLGRAFERDTSIDRDAVELCVELMTDDVLTSVAEAMVSGWSMKLYQRHPSGLDRWLPTRVEVITHLVGSPDAVDPAAAVSPAPVRTRAQLTPPPATGEVKVQTPDPIPIAFTETNEITEVTGVTQVTDDEPQPSAAEHTTSDGAKGTTDHSGERHDDEAGHQHGDQDLHDDQDLHGHNGHNSNAGRNGHHDVGVPGTSFGLPAFRMPTFETAPTIEQPATDPVASLLDTPSTALFTRSDAPPESSSPVEEQPLVGLAPSAMEALMSTSIKDEVADAVRRALAQIDTL